MLQTFANFATTTLSAGISAGATSLTIATASQFPTLSTNQYCYAMLGTPATGPWEEICITGISGNILTLGPSPMVPSSTGRGMDGTTAQAWAAGTVIQIVPTAQAMNDLQNNVITPLAYGAVGNGIADDTAAWQTTLASGLQISGGGPQYSYKISGTLTLRTGHCIDMMGATMTQVTASTRLFLASGVSNILITRGNFVGYGAGDYAGADPSYSSAVYGAVSGSNIQIYNNTFTGFSGSAARFAGQSACAFVGNTVVGPTLANNQGACYAAEIDNGTYGTTTTSGYLLANNDVSSVGCGFRVNGNGITPSMQVRIVGNRITQTYQHGLYLGAAVSDITVSGNAIYNTYLDGIKIQPDSLSSYLSDMYNISVVGNTIHMGGNDGIDCQNGTTPGTAVLGIAPNTRNLVIRGNSIKSYSGIGASILDASGVNVSGNSIEDCGFEGVYLLNVVDAVVSDNQIKQCAQIGIFSGNSANNSKFLFQGNTINDIGSIGSTFTGSVTGSTLTLNSQATNGFALGGTLTSPVAGTALYTAVINTQLSGSLGALNSTYALSTSPGNVANVGMVNLVLAGATPYGIEILNGTEITVCDNYVNDGNSQMYYGYYLPTACGTFSFYNNQCLAATHYGFRGNGSAFRRYDNNLMVGTSGASTTDPVLPTVVSATTLFLATAGTAFSITFTNNITSISAAGHCGHMVALIFTGILTVTNGSNLKLAGSNFTTSAGSALTLVCDGTNWYEIGRKA